MAAPTYSASGTAVAENSNWPLNGTTRFFNFGSIADLTPSATTPFTAIAWIKTTGSGCIFSRQDTGSSVLRGWSMFVIGGAFYGGIVSDATGSDIAVQASTNAAVNDGIEHQVALIYDGSTNLSGLTLAIEGVSQSFATSTDNLTAGQLTNAAANVNIAARNGGEFLSGSIRHVSFWNKALSLAELAQTRLARSPSNLLATTMSANLIFWSKLGENDTPAINGILDSSGQGHHGTANFNGVEVSWPTHSAGQLGLVAVETTGLVSARSGQGVTDVINNLNDTGFTFDGVDDLISFGNVAAMQVTATTPFTIACWVKTTASTVPIFTKQGANGVPPSRGWAMFVVSGKTYGGLTSVSTGNNQVQAAYNTTVNDGIWHLLIVSYDGSTNVSGLNARVDNVAQVRTSIIQDNLASGDVTTSTAPVQLGARDSAEIAGPVTMKHASFWSKELSASEQAELWGGGTPPDLATTSMWAANGVFWVKLDQSDNTGSGGIIDHGSAGANGTTNGGLSFSTTRLRLFSKIAASSSEPPIQLILGDGTDHAFAKITTFSGTDQTNPFNAATFSTFGPLSTTANCGSITTSVNDCLAVLCFAAADQRTLNAITNGALASITERSDENTALGNDGSLAIVTASKTTAGAFGTSTGTWSSSTNTATAILALMGPQAFIITGPYALPEPDQVGYTNDISRGVFEVPLEGGLSRRRNDVYFAGHTVNVTWILTATEYTRLMGLFLMDLKYSSQPFLLDLIVDIGLPTTHKCRTLGGMPKLTQQKGDAYWVSATLQCEKNPTYTGLIIYQEPNRIVFSTENPFLYALINPIEVGDSIRIISSKGIHPTGSTPLNLDGIYEVAGHVGFNVLTLTSPELVNSDWTVLAGLAGTAQYGDASHGNVISTVTRVPIL